MKKKVLNFINISNQTIYLIITFFENNIKDTFPKNKFFIDEFLHGIQLKSYEFEKYKTKKTEKVFDIKISFKTNLFKLSTNKRFNSLLKVYLYQRFSFRTRQYFTSR